MFHNLLTPVRLTTLMCGALLVPSVRANGPNMENAKNRGTQTEGLNAFTHTAYIPANADLKSIRFQKIRMVRIPASVRRTFYAGYCATTDFRDPGGSMYCPATKTESVSSAYEVTYSFMGEPMPADEFANRHFTFAVYFRPEEISPEIRRAISAKNPDTSDIAGYFSLATDRELVQRVTVDDAQSTFCAGTDIDGLWHQDQPDCQADIHYTGIATPSGYITVNVNPISRAAKRTAIIAANWENFE